MRCGSEDIKRERIPDTVHTLPCICPEVSDCYRFKKELKVKSAGVISRPSKRSDDEGLTTIALGDPDQPSLFVLPLCVFSFTPRH